MSTKEILEIIVVPLTLALIALLWPAIQSWSRRRAFRRLIVRELEEISPHPRGPTLTDWWEHQQKTFVHQEIFDKASENRDFILSLEPDLVYYVTQLWQAKKEPNWAQWDYCLGCLSARRWDNNKHIAALRWLNPPRWDKNGRIAIARALWQHLYCAYQVKRNPAQLPTEYDLAPDGSEIRFLPTEDCSGLTHHTLPADAISQAVYYKTSERVLTFMQGQGQLWRKQSEKEIVVDVKPGMCFTIPADVKVQIRNTGEEPLCYLIATMPPRSDVQEAVQVDGIWKAI